MGAHTISVDSFVGGHRVSPLVVILLFSVLIQSLFLAALPGPWRANQAKDYWESYEPVARNILDGKGIVDARGEVATVTPPGYPLILSVVFSIADATGLDSLTLIRLGNVLTTSVSSILLFRIAELMFNTRVGMISALLWMSYPFNLWLIKQPNSEVPFTLFLYVGIWSLVLSMIRHRPGLAAVSGATLGLAALVRPIGLLLPFGIAVIILFYQGLQRFRRFGYAAILLTGFLVAIAPWEVHVLRSTGQLIPLSTNGVYAMFKGLTFALTPGPGGDWVTVPDDVRLLMDRLSAQAQGGVVRTTGELLTQVVRETTESPVAMTKLLGLKLARSWYGTDAKWQEDIILMIQSFYLAMIAGGIVLGLRNYRERVFWIVLLLSLMTYFWGMTVLVDSILRYMVPALGLGMILAAVTLDSIVSWRAASALREAVAG